VPVSGWRVQNVCVIRPVRVTATVTVNWEVWKDGGVLWRVFSSFDEEQKQIDSYRSRNYVQPCVSDSQTVDATKSGSGIVGWSLNCDSNQLKLVVQYMADQGRGLWRLGFQQTHFLELCSGICQKTTVQSFVLLWVGVSAARINDTIVCTFVDCIIH